MKCWTLTCSCRRSTSGPRRSSRSDRRLRGTPAPGAGITTLDKSCTIPKIPSAGVGFVNFQYSGSNDDGAGNTLDRTKEGYVEIIEMATYSSSSTIAAEVTHLSGTPPCGSKLTDANASNEAFPPTGGLFGGISLINVLSGTDYTEDAVALDNYSTFNIYAASGSISPDLSQAFPPTSQVLAGGNVLHVGYGPRRRRHPRLRIMLTR